MERQVGRVKPATRRQCLSLNRAVRGRPSGQGCVPPKPPASKQARAKESESDKVAKKFVSAF